jgi:hypothetical protein
MIDQLQILTRSQIIFTLTSHLWTFVPFTTLTATCNPMPSQMRIFSLFSIQFCCAAHILLLLCFLQSFSLFSLLPR